MNAARRERDFRSVSADNAHLASTRRRVSARITAVGFADRETVKCTARDVRNCDADFEVRRHAGINCDAPRVNRGSVHNRHYRLSHAITSDDNTAVRQPRVITRTRATVRGIPRTGGIPRAARRGAAAAE